MSVVSCAVEGVYTNLCRDLDTASGGMDPSETVLHSDGFIRVDRMDLDTDLEGSAIDRKVRVLYEGTDRWTALNNGLGGKRQRYIVLSVEIGYFYADHEAETRKIAGDDEQLLIQKLGVKSNVPACTAGCEVQGYFPRSSSIRILDENRLINAIQILALVYGTS